MKKIVITFTLLFILVTSSSDAQNSSVNISTSTGNSILKIVPTVKFYFFPNLDAYFNVETKQYLYKINGAWILNSVMPTVYRGYSIYNNYKVEITDYHNDKPYEKLAEHKIKFPYYSNDRKGKLAALKAKKIIIN